MMCVSRKQRKWYFCFAQTRNKRSNVDMSLFVKSFRILFEISFDFDALSDLHFLIVWKISSSVMFSCVFATTFEYRYLSVSLKFVCSVLKKNWINNILTLSSNSIAFLIIAFSDSFCIKSETLRIFFDRWLLFFAQRTKRQRNVVWFVSVSKILLNFNFFFLTMIFFLTLIACKYVLQLCFVCVAFYFRRRRFVVETTFAHFRF